MAPRTIVSLREYLRESGFANIYRYIVSSRHYAVTPFAVNAATRGAVLATDTYLEGELEGRRLLWTLFAHATLPREALTARERDLAAELAEAGLLHTDGAGDHDVVAPGDWQLICVGDNTLFVDAAIAFPRRERMHEVYIGPDTLLLLHYLDAPRLPRGARVLDLCTGSGVIGLDAARAASRVVSTDIADKPLFIAPVNRDLNARGDTIEVRREAVADTLRADETWDLVTCNPPFIATPPELAAPIYARGPGRDGCDMMRDILAALDRILAPGGACLMVADILGDDRHPCFLAELREAARSFAVEVYIDQKLPIAGHIDAMSHILARENPALDPSAVAARTREFLAGELAARHVYLCVIRVRRGAPGLLVLDRYRAA
ncbi:MAG: methyltransferase [Deltaproteobacteria bacterium]|nr:methyltransferase [Deltaproteobacteria bacterium]MCW5806768.1 methyltransferase [Deltaproteobacteria bacterium]